MKIAPFSTELFFSKYEFTTPHLLCASDCETLSVGELLQVSGVNTADLLELPLSYTESAGNPTLRAAVAELYSGVEPAEVTMLGAPEEGIYLSLRTLLEPGDHVIVLTPAYDSLLHLADHITHNVTRWPIRPVPDGWSLDLDELEHLMTASTRLVIVNFPHNPTGFLPNAADFERLIGIVQRHGVWLLCDEMYRGLERQPADRLPSAVEQYDRAIVLSGLSKTYGLPGLRTGWLIIRHPATRSDLINWKHYTTICAAAPSEILATAALHAHNLLADRSRQIIGSNLTMADAFFRRRAAMFDWRPPQAGSVALVGVNVNSASEYCQILAEQAGVLLLPGPNLGADDHSVRFGFGRVNFPEALAAYDRYLEG